MRPWLQTATRSAKRATDVHVVLDEHRRHAGVAQHAHQGFDDAHLLGGGDAAGGFVHQHQAGLQGDRHGDVGQLAGALVQRIGAGLGDRAEAEASSSAIA